MTRYVLVMLMLISTGLWGGKAFAQMEYVPIQDVVDGIIEGGGPNTLGRLQERDPNFKDGTDIITGRGWSLIIDENGKPVSKSRGVYIIRIGVSGYNSRRVRTYSAYIEIVNIQTSEIHRVSVGGTDEAALATSPKEAVSLAMQKFNGGNKSGSFATPPF